MLGGKRGILQPAGNVDRLLWRDGRRLDLDVVPHSQKAWAFKLMYGVQLGFMCDRQVIHPIPAMRYAIGTSVSVCRVFGGDFQKQFCTNRCQIRRDAQLRAWAVLEEPWRSQCSF